MLAATKLRLGHFATTVVCLLGASLTTSLLYGLSYETGRGELEFLGTLLIPAAQDRQQTQKRRLVANDVEYCAAYGISDEEDVTVVKNTTLSLGMGVTNALTGKKRAGGEGGTWYEDTLASLVVEYCVEAQKSVHHRYVTSENVTAAKDKYGICVQVPEGDSSAYAAGLCERVANCYWEEPREGQARSRRFTDNQYAVDEAAAQDYVRNIVLHYGMLGFVLAAAVFAGCVKFSVSR